MHVVSVDRAQRMLDLRVEGFLTVDEVASSARDVHEAIARLGGDPKDHVTLYDLSAASVASADVIASFRDFMANPVYQPVLGRRIAFVSGSALVTMQLKRVGKDKSEISIFPDRASAVDWLLAA